MQAASRVAKSGVPVVRSTRVATGSVGRNVELNDDELGFIASDELNPQKSRILLSLALLKTRTPADLQNLFGKPRLSSGVAGYQTPPPGRGSGSPG